jgi:hypothetical protein
MIKKQTWRVVIDRDDFDKYVGCVLCNDHEIIIDFKTTVGTTPKPPLLVKTEEPEEEQVQNSHANNLSPLW